MNEKTDKQQAMSVSIKSICLNLSLSLLKLVAGLAGNSTALVSDGIHAMSDVFSTLLVMISIAVSRKNGKAKWVENFAAIAIALFLLSTGLVIGYNALILIIGGMPAGTMYLTPSILAMGAAIVSIGVKEWMFWFTKRTAKAISSDAMMADAWHQRLDALVSVGSLVGIVAARMGVPILDPIASIIICVLIVKAAVQIFFEAASKIISDNKR